jgi:hypothetical protein
MSFISSSNFVVTDLMVTGNNKRHTCVDFMARSVCGISITAPSAGVIPPRKQILEQNDYRTTRRHIS